MSKSKLKDRTGEKYNKLTISSFDRLEIKGKKYKYYWNCICECGNLVSIQYSDLKSENTKSCGCHRKHKRINRCYTPEYKAWENMRARCYNPNFIKFKDYGGRGIMVCDEWKNSYEIFLNDVGLKPTIKHSLDRIDVNGNYTKDNCRWSTQREQCNNRRDNIIVVDIITNVEYPSINEAARMNNIKPITLWTQLRCRSKKNKTNLRIRE